MPELTVLDRHAHSALQLSPDRALMFARARHMMPLRVNEIPGAIQDFPVFISRVSVGGQYALSALTSFDAGQNLFLSDGKWLSSFQPVSMQTYPFFLVRGKQETDEPVLGFDPDSEALGLKGGENLFTSKGKPSLTVSQVKAKLMEDARNTVRTFEFFDTIEGLGLIRAVDLSIKYKNDKINKVRGLHMINEDQLHALSNDAFSTLRDKGFLAPIYALLFSIAQLNGLIRRHNARNMQSNLIININLEVSKDLAQS